MISIIIATYNSESTILKCINSILQQDYSEYQIIIQDGASQDNTLKLIGDMNCDICVNSGSDEGVYDAWNKALIHAKGQWCIFLGSDDYFASKDSLTKVLPYLKKAAKTDIPLVYGENLIANENHEIIGSVGVDWTVAKETITKEMSIRHPGCFHHMSLFEGDNSFSKDYKIVGDHYFILKNLTRGVLFYPFSIVVHVVGGLSTSPNNMLELVKENFKMRKELELRPLFLVNSLLIKRIVIFILYKILGENNLFKFLLLSKKIRGWF